MRVNLGNWGTRGGDRTWGNPAMRGLLASLLDIYFWRSAVVYMHKDMLFVFPTNFRFSIMMKDQTQNSKAGANLGVDA